MPELFGASLSELLRHGSEFGLGHLQGRAQSREDEDERRIAEEERQREEQQRQRDLLSQALLDRQRRGQIDNTRSLIDARDRTPEQKPPSAVQGEGIVVGVFNDLGENATPENVVEGAIEKGLGPLIARALTARLFSSQAAVNRSVESGARGQRTQDRVTSTAKRRDMESDLVAFAFDLKRQSKTYEQTLEFLRAMPQFVDADEAMFLRAAGRAFDERANLSLLDIFRRGDVDLLPSSPPDSTGTGRE